LQPIAGPTLVGKGGRYGNAILTRLHPIDVHHWDLTVGRHEPRGAIDAMLRHGGARLRVIATHLGLLPGERRRQIHHLLQLVGKDNRLPTVLLGDLNEWFLWGRPLRWMHRHFQSTPAPATFPSGHPLFALDRIWVEPRRALRDIAAHASDLARVASDHLPVVANIVFDDTAIKAEAIDAAVDKADKQEALSA
jgi:endonuclease/exonuclease/phosphatase family metal-dependent hydrolase